MHHYVPLGPPLLHPLLALLLQLLDELALLLLGAGLVQLGLEEVHQLVDPDIPGPQPRQQIVMLGGVVAGVNFLEQ